MVVEVSDATTNDVGVEVTVVNAGSGVDVGVSRKRCPLRMRGRCTYYKSEFEKWRIGAQEAVRKVHMHPIQIYCKNWKLGRSN